MNSTVCIKVAKVVLCVAMSAALVSGGDVLAQSKPAEVNPRAALSKMIADPKSASETLAALRSTEDPDLLPLYIALSQSSNKDWRMFGVNALDNITGNVAVAALAERLGSDSEMVVRREALVGLATAKQLTKEQLVAAMAVTDESLQCMAARTAVSMKMGQDAVPTLTALVKSRNAFTSNIARLSLLGQGQADQLPPLREFFQNPDSPKDVLAILMEQITEEKIAAGLELAEIIVKSDQPWQIKIRAYRAISAVSPAAPQTILEAIQASKSASEIPFRVYMLQVLAARDDSQKQLESLAAGKDVVAMLATFELARAKGSDEAAAALDKVVATGHPVVIEYVLDRGRADLKDMGAKADFYTPALLKFIESVQTDPIALKPEHRLATMSATFLADLGTPAAMDGLKRIISGKYAPPVRLVATGLLRTKNPAACDLARPLLRSGYGEMVTDAALVLGHFGDADGAEALRHIAARPDRNSKIMVALANYYLLKIDKKSAAAVEELAKEIK